MTFRRTSSGLSNLHLFLNVDLVVFVEGGQKSFTFKEVLAGDHSSESMDILFWQNLFGMLLPSVSCSFRPIGSKTTLLSIAEEVLSGQASHVCVAIDRDCDHITGALKKGKGVVYTKGYSWENDVWRKEVLQETFFALCPVDRLTTDVRKEIDECYDQFPESIFWPVYVDTMLRMFDKSLIPTERVESLIMVGSNLRPVINKARILGLLHEINRKKTKKYFFGKKVKISALDDCNGRLLASFGYRVLLFLLKKFSKLHRIAKHHANSFAIASFFTLADKGGFKSRIAHYKKQILLMQ